MSEHRRLLLATTIVIGLCVTVVSAQILVTDPAITLRNAAIATLKEQMLDTATEQAQRVERMARRLSADASLDRYALPDPPMWRIHWFVDDGTFLYANPYNAALNYGDGNGRGFQAVARRREAPTDELAGFGEDDLGAEPTIRAELATLDAADATIIAATDQTGQLRYNGRKELLAIDALEGDATDPSEAQSATAVLDKISGASLIRARQQQARIQFLAGIVEQLLVDNKRARDTEAAAMNMRLEQLRYSSVSTRSLLTGAADDLRSWKQP
jgi:hypothetical protein